MGQSNAWPVFSIARMITASFRATAARLKPTFFLSFTPHLRRPLSALVRVRVTVNAVAPGPIRTRAIDEMPKNVIDSIVADIPMGRIGQPEDVANAILFFASSQSDYITGQTLLVNGGH
jgi:NAD(P)-dependent dehydrogenase (short-subunit alcohol dehydrogenase family)